MSKTFRFCIGPMSKNIVDAIISFANKNDVNVILIPSRRQIDYNSGYVNRWTTLSFANYVRSQSKNVLIKRDHGGPNQGDMPDDGYRSIIVDANNFDMIHIDPWKSAKSFEDGCQQTLNLINISHCINRKVKFEIGTEQAIFEYSPEQLYELILYLNRRLSASAFSNIAYAVIQCGTALAEDKNVGVYDEQKLKDMLKVCKDWNLISKEHNGDYVSNDMMATKFQNGLDLINIAPEFGQLETKVYFGELLSLNKVDALFDICYTSKKWEKWVDSSFDSFYNKEKLIGICGHYVFSTEAFLELKRCMTPDINDRVKEKVTQKLEELYAIG